MEDMRKEGYFTGWQWNNEHKIAEGAHRVYYNDIDITTGNLLCDGQVVGNVRLRCARMEIIDKRNNYMW